MAVGALHDTGQPSEAPSPAAAEIDPDTVAFLRAAGCVYADEEARELAGAAHSTLELRSFLDRRAEGEPLEYIVGWAGFCGMRIPLRRGVFVPRRRSEFLVECAVRAVRCAAASAEDGSRSTRMLDMCCGSGAIGLAVAMIAGDVVLLAADDSAVAVECARQNLSAIGGRVYQGDLFGAIPRTERRNLDLIVANAPYVPTDEIPRLPAEARLHEPISTLDGGPDGTSTQARILTSAKTWLREDGVVMIETAPHMANMTASVAEASGFAAEIRHSPELEATVVVATCAS